VRAAEPAVDALFEPPDDPFLAGVRGLRDALLESADARSPGIPAEVLG